MLRIQDKERLLKAAKEKLQLSYKGKAISRNPKSEKSME
jgi:hypothetical protein